MEAELLWVRADKPAATLILAHGAGAAMDSGFMNLLCLALASRGIATVRFEFPYMAKRREGGGRRPPDRAPVLLQRWRDVFQEVRASRPPGQLLIGGKSMGGRLASMVAEELQPDGFCCFGYPFLPPGKRDRPSRTEHFATTAVPGLIVQGTRDPFGKPGDIHIDGWPANIELVWLDDGDHDLQPRKRSGFNQADLIGEAAAQVARWL